MRPSLLLLLLVCAADTAIAAGFSPGQQVELTKDAPLYFKETNLIRTAKAGDRFTVIYVEPQRHRVYVAAKDGLGNDIALGVAEDALILAGESSALKNANEFTYGGVRFLNPKVVGPYGKDALLIAHELASGLSTTTAVPRQAVPAALIQQYEAAKAQATPAPLTPKPLYSFSFPHIPVARNANATFPIGGATFRFAKRAHAPVSDSHELDIPRDGSPDCRLGLVINGVAVNSDIVFEFQTKEAVGALNITIRYFAEADGEADCFLLLDPPSLSSLGGLKVTFVEKKIPLPRGYKSVASAAFKVAPPMSNFRVGIAFPGSGSFRISGISVELPP